MAVTQLLRLLQSMDTLLLQLPSLCTAQLFINFFPSNSPSDLLTVRVSNTITNYSLHSSNGKVNMSPDKGVLIAWDSYGKVYFYNSSNFSLKYTYNPINQINSLVTENIHFNSDGTLIAL